MCKLCTSNILHRIEYITEWPQYLMIKTNISIFFTSEGEKTTYEVIDCIMYEADHYYSKTKIPDGNWLICNDTAHQKTLTESQIPTNSLINCIYCIVCKKIDDTNKNNRNIYIQTQQNHTDDQDAANLINLAESASLWSQLGSSTAPSTTSSAHKNTAGRGYSNRGSIPGRGRVDVADREDVAKNTGGAVHRQRLQQLASGCVLHNDSG